MVRRQQRIAEQLRSDTLANWNLRSLRKGEGYAGPPPGGASFISSIWTTDSHSVGRVIPGYTRNTRPQADSHDNRTTLTHKLFLAAAWLLKRLLRIGLPMGPMVPLTVRGRKSGQPRTTPLDLFEGSGRSFLISTHRQEGCNWVRNLRTAGEGVISRGHSRCPVTAFSGSF